MFARFDENPAMTLRVIKETKRYGRTDGRPDGRTDNVKIVYPLQTKFAGGIIIFFLYMSIIFVMQSKCLFSDISRPELITIKLCTNFQNPKSSSC